MKVVDTGINGLVVLEPKVFEDDRGYFMETYNSKTFKELNIDTEFVQANESVSTCGVLRGIHFQTVRPQGKLVRCTEGEVFDVAVDLRVESETFGKWFGVYLSDANKKMMYIPPRFGHGFLVVSDRAKFNYMCTSTYDMNSDSGIMYNDPKINIEWPKVSGEYIISQKDLNHTLSIDDISWEQ